MPFWLQVVSSYASLSFSFVQVRDGLLAACISAGVTVQYDAGLRALRRHGAPGASNSTSTRISISEATGSSGGDGTSAHSSEADRRPAGISHARDRGQDSGSSSSSSSVTSDGSWSCELLDGRRVSSDVVVRSLQ